MTGENIDIDQERLIKMKIIIEKMNKFHQIEILKLLSSTNTITINENNNGVFINLSDLDVNLLDEVFNYIDYVSEQESELKLQEEKKEEYKNVFFKENESLPSRASVKKKLIHKDNKDNMFINVSNAQTSSS